MARPSVRWGMQLAVHVPHAVVQSASRGLQMLLCRIRWLVSKTCCLSQAVREAACRVLGALAAASRSAAAADAVAAEKRPAKKAAAERTLAGYVKACLAAPMIDAAVLGRREVRLVP